MQGHATGAVDAQPLAALILNATPNGRATDFNWQAKCHEGAVTCLLQHSCNVFDDLAGMQEVHLLLSGGTDGITCARCSRTGESFLSLALHTDEVRIA